MPARKVLSRFLTIYAIVFVLVLCLIPEHLRRMDFDRAFFAWLRDRSPQNETALRGEERKNDLIQLGSHAVIALVFVTLGTGIYSVGHFCFAQNRHSTGEWILDSL